MIFLISAILCSVLLGFIFKLYARFQVDVLQAIVVNYFTCVCCGTLYAGYFPVGPAAGQPAPWLPWAMALGVVFITGFNAAAQTVRYFGVTISQIMQKMSILMTVPFAILFYHESGGVAKWSGFVLALVAIVLVNWPKKGESGGTFSLGMLWLPIVTWVLSGILEVMLVYIQGEKMIDPADVRLICTIFASAGVLGTATVLYGYATGQRQFAWRNVIGGIALGIPNFGSMYFILKALSAGWEGSFVFPVVNVGIIIVSTIGAVTLFRERLSGVNWVGIALALGAILLIAG
jgi:drug/metabolite transporter (DMT)-like permease